MATYQNPYDAVQELAAQTQRAVDTLNEKISALELRLVAHRSVIMMLKTAALDDDLRSEEAWRELIATHAENMRESEIDIQDEEIASHAKAYFEKLAKEIEEFLEDEQPSKPTLSVTPGSKGVD